MNEGKRFEEDFQNSIPEDIFYYRLRDAGGWKRGKDTRFTPSNICDLIIYKEPNLFLLELKSTKGKSLPFSRVRDNQIKGLLNANTHRGLKTGLVLNFRELSKTYYLDIQKAKEYKEMGLRKSFPVDWISENGILIEQEKKITRYKYNIEKFIEEASID